MKPIERNLRIEGRVRTLSARNHRHRAVRDAQLAKVLLLVEPKADRRHALEVSLWHLGVNL